MRQPAAVDLDSLFLSDTDPRVLEKQEQQQPTYLALSYINRYACTSPPLHRGQHCSTNCHSLHAYLQPCVCVRLADSSND